ncbi:ribonuclease 3-like protein 2 isoform X2 [Aristolochia californica]|uniref:ribonuclease 3-like protein 2 isoform X2 n=1 Tax=Aristolochia californica TaxID=171875 RepID=UPI0035DA2E38
MKTKDLTLAFDHRRRSPLVVDVEMADELAQVEAFLGYQFRDRRLLEEALTHSSHPNAVASYQRLEFVGDAALGLLFANHIFLAYPHLEPGDLSLLRSANISTEKLARVAIRHNLYQYLRKDAPNLDDKVREFVRAIKEESDETGYTSSVKAPKVLADIVEAVVAAVYIDCGFDLKALWVVFRGLLEPIITKETLQLQPVTALFEVCQKRGMHVDIKHWRKGSRSIASVYVDGKLFGSGSSENKDIAKLNAAKESLKVLLNTIDLDIGETTVDEKDAKQKLHELCSKKRWSKPCYSLNPTTPCYYAKKGNEPNKQCSLIS